MIISEDQIKQIMKKRCPKHPTFNCDLINFSQDAPVRRICVKCSQQNKLSFHQWFSIKDLLEADNKTILETFPPLKNEELHQQLILGQNEDLEGQIEGFLKELKDDFEAAFIRLRHKTKQQISKRREMNKKMLEAYEEIAQINKLKEIVFSADDDADTKLEEVIQAAWKNQDSNTIKIESLISELGTVCGAFSLDEPKRLALQTINNIESTQFFESFINLLPQTQFVKSTYKTSQYLSIGRNDNGQLVAENTTNGQFDGQAYLDFLINPSEKYIIQLNLEQIENENKQFLFGIAFDSTKDSIWMFNQKMSYFDLKGTYGLNKQVKGPPMITAEDSIKKKSLEVRIHLQEKYVRVGTLPNYESVVELDNPNLIDLKTQYRFFVFLYNPSNKITITMLHKVWQYDDKFDQ